MQQRGWIVALVAVVLVGLALYLSLDDGGAGDARETPRMTAPAASAGGGGAHVAEGSPGGPVSAGAPRRSGADGGVAVAHVGVRTDFPEPGARTPTGVPVSRGLPRSDPDADRSAGWRLGQTRRRVALLESRVTLYQDAVDRFVAEGRDDLAGRQRAVLERIQRRVVEFREEEAELLEAAQAEGTMGEVDQGYEEGEPDNPQRAAPAGVSPR